jgi:hypothetical protein
MSTQEETVSTDVSTAVATDSPNPHIDPAQARLEELRMMREQIPAARAVERAAKAAAKVAAARPAV